MSAKLVRLRGLERIRRLQAEMERGTLERVTAAAAEAESALHDEAAAIADANTQSRAALRSGDRGEWLYADAQGEVARSNISRLGVLLQRRQAAIPPAMDGYLACRRTHEQAKVLLANAHSEATVAESRKAQKEIDEWSASRWMRRMDEK